MPPNAPHDLVTTHSLNVMFSSVKQGDVDTSMLDPEQLKALSLAQDLDSFFLTGDPGTGKTFTLSKIIEVLQTRVKPCQLGVTASTGAAANRLQGQTIHSWAGLTGSETCTEQALKKVKDNTAASTRWLECKVLILDEVSMITVIFLTLLDFIARNMRKCELAFGGISLITSGDFLQLPPVSMAGKRVEFAFQSPAWDAIFKDNHIRLTTVYRQNEEGLLDILKDIRTNNITPRSQMLLVRQQRPIQPSYLPHLETTRLYCTVKLANQANEDRLTKISGQATTYPALDLARSTAQKRLLLSAPVGSIVKLKVGARVVLRKNIGKGLFNGSMGVVLGFYTSHNVLPPDERAERPQTIRSIRNVKVDDNGVPIHAPPGPISTVGGRELTLFPLVKFEIGPTHEHVLILDEEFVFQAIQDRKEYTATRFQIPLSLGWAMTIHKSQGSGFEKVVVDCRQSFADGQIYVGLSRAQSLKGLQIVGLNVATVKMNAIAAKWMKDKFGSV